jgi:hypothetical protein
MTPKSLSILASAAVFSLASGPAFAQSQCGIVDLLELMAIQPSAGTDADVNTALMEMASSWATVQGEGNQEIGTTLSSSSDPKMAGVGALVAASGSSLQAMGAAFLKLPGVISAIDESRDDADDLYIALNTERGDDGAFWPGPDQNSSAALKGTTVKLPGVSGIVPYVLGLLSDDSVSIQLYDYDGASRDDHLGQVTFSLKDVGRGPLNTLMISEKHGGTVYAIRYQVVPVSCNYVMAEQMRTAQAKPYYTETQAAELWGAFMAFGFPFLITELKAGNVVL